MISSSRLCSLLPPFSRWLQRPPSFPSILQSLPERGAPIAATGEATDRCFRRTCCYRFCDSLSGPFRPFAGTPVFNLSPLSRAEVSVKMSLALLRRPLSFFLECFFALLDSLSSALGEAVQGTPPFFRFGNCVYPIARPTFWALPFETSSRK